jgi:two-component system, cell cycle sensor histidine kinase and response regulator CckA
MSEAHPPHGGDRAVPSPAPVRAAHVVLVVDDDPGVREVAARVLERAGYQVLQAGEGSEALRVARAHTGPLHLVLTDVVMPGMNGRELGQRMSEERPDTRLLYMSAYTEDEVILRGIRVADVSFLSKPFTLDGLQSAVRDALA